MNRLDWIIIIVPTIFVMCVGFYSRKYVRGVVDFIAAGRICGRYILSVGDVANALSIIGLVAYVEVTYKTGFALNFWSNIIAPLSIIMALTGYCTYRFRETRAMSLGQFLEMRYSRSFRIFAASLRSISEMLANMIMPALAARFFIYILDLPRYFTICGITVSTFVLIMIIVLTLAISLICLGGTLGLVITDAIQGMLLYPLMVVFIIFIFTKFSWSNEIVPVLSDRVSGESFINPYDIKNLRDFNLFFVFVTIFVAILHRASWTGAGVTCAAKTPHEQKMAGVLGAWRGTIISVFFVVIGIAIITMLNHKNFAPEAHEMRLDISQRIVSELADTPEARKQIISQISTVPIHNHTIGVDSPLSDAKNLDTPYLEAARKGFISTHEEAQANDKSLQFKTLYHQLMLAVSMRHLLPTGLLGLFCLLLVLAMLSTDDTRIFSASMTIAQDIILPLRKKPFTSKQQIRLLQWVSVGVGVFFFFGSLYMAQLDYINLFVTLMCNMWMGGCGPVMIFGLYSRFGTTVGAWTSLVTGMILGIGTMLLQRNWANAVYPWLEEHGLVNTVDNVLTVVSKPLNPYVVWEMNPVKCPVNSYEFFVMTMLITLFLYVVVSFLTCKEMFNLDRMLHRGIYSTEEVSPPKKWGWRNIFSQLIGITPEYSKGDRFIAWGIFFYSFVLYFCIAFIGVIIWNAVSPWSIQWWCNYYLIYSFIIPGCIAAITTFWFGIGGMIDMFRMFKTLRERSDNPLDDGRVEGNVSVADKEFFAEREKQARSNKNISPEK